MARLLFLLILVSAVTLLPSQVRAGGSADPVILTIAGNIGKTNRGKTDAFRDGFLNYHEKTFDRALEITRSDLAALSQVVITANGDSENWTKPAALKGPLLADVLALAGVEKQDITLVALDGYAAEFDAKAQSSHKWILAHTMNGKPLGIGGRGPLWLARDTGDGKASEEELGKWVWSVFYIEVTGK